MNEVLKEVDELIENSNNVPLELKPIVKAICKGYIRESNGKIPISGIINVCNTVFNKVDSSDTEFTGENKIFATTTTDYDEKCNVIHRVDYINDSNYKKLITILTHELGHVITEPAPCFINQNNVYPIAKRTTTYYFNCYYDNNVLMAYTYGKRMADGFLESICWKIFASNEFRDELKKAGYDLEDYIYKDERLFPSRVYDEYKACFELFDYIMDGALFDFSCKTFSSNEEILEFIDKNRLNVIFGCLDKSNEALWDFKKYEGKNRDEEFDKLLQVYNENKELSVDLSLLLLELYNKTPNDLIYQQLLDTYKNTLEKQKLLPLEESYSKGN